MSLRHQKQVVFVLIILLAFALRMWQIDARSMWFDESFEYWASSVDLNDLPTTVTTSFQPPLYNVLLHFWLLIGQDVIWLRLLSVTFSLLGLLGLMILGHRLLGMGGALTTGLFVAILPTEIKYAQEVAEYALMSFALSWAVLSLLRALKASTWKAWGLWSLFSVAAVYSHYGAAIIVLALSVLAFIESVFRYELDKLRKQATVTVLGLILGLPLLFSLPRQLPPQVGNTVAIGDLVSEIRRFVETTGKTFLFPLTGDPFSPLPAWLCLLGVGSVLVLSLFVLPLCQKEQRRLTLWFWGAYLVYYFGVRASLYAYGNYGFRYMLILLPLLALVMTTVTVKLYGSRILPIRAAGVGLALLILASAAYSLPNRSVSEKTRGHTAWPETQDMREVILYWKQHASHDAPTYVYYGAVPAFRYYARLYGVEREFPLPPAWYAACWQGLAVEPCVVDDVHYGAWFSSLSVEEKLASMQNTFGAMPASFWIIFSHTHLDEDKELMHRLQADYMIEDDFKQVSAAAYLLTER